jgi:WD40 repeat protein
MTEKHNHFISGAGVTALAFTVDGKTLATIQAGRPVYLWDPATRNRLAIVDWPEVESIAPSPTGSALAAGGKTKAIRIWE